MPSKVFVGNLDFNTTRDEVQSLFAQVGNVRDVFLPNDRETGPQQAALASRRAKDQLMNWKGEERRSGNDRRLSERRRTMRYGVQNLVIIDGITWIDAEGEERRQRIRRRQDREALVRRLLEDTRP